MSKPTPPLTTDDKLDAILQHLKNLDRRDRLRMWGSFFHGILSFIPLLLLLASAWYLYTNGAELMKTVTQEATKQAEQYMKDSAGNSFGQLQKFLK